MALKWDNFMIQLANWLGALIVFGAIWLFIPSPLHKCPTSEVVIDSLYTVKGDTLIHVELAPPIEAIDRDSVKVDKSLWVTGIDDLTGKIMADTILTFRKETIKDLPEGTKAYFRSTTYYFPGDTVAETIHEISIPPRPVQIKTTLDTVYVIQTQKITDVEKPTPVLESPAFWAVAGIVVGGVIMGIFMNNRGK